MDDAVERSTTMTRSEERLSVRVERAAVARAVLRRRIVVEERLIRVQVRHEEADLEIVPLEEPRPLDARQGPAHLAPAEFVLHREEVVISRRLVPVERVRLTVDQVRTVHEAVEEVRREQVDLERSGGDVAAAPSDPADPSAPSIPDPHTGTDPDGTPVENPSG